MKRVVLVFFFMGMSIFSQSYNIAGEEVKGKLKEITKERYPNANTVLVDSLEVFEYDKDGKSRLEVERYMKILDEDGKKRISEQTISYNENYGDAKYEFIKIIKKDGTEKEIEIKSNMTKKIDPRAQSSNIYSSKQKIVMVNIPELEVGDTIHTKEVHTVKKPLIDGESDYTTYGENTFPIVHSKSVVIAPKNNPIEISKVLDEKPQMYDLKIEENKNETHHIFTVKDVPRILDEPNMLPLSRVLMRWKVSTLSKWEELGNWYYNLTEPRIDKINNGIKEKTKELIKNAKTDKEKYENIYFWVSRNIRYMGDAKEEDRPGFEPHDVSYTFDTKTGVCRDKAALIVAMLRYAGFESYMVLMNAGRKIDKEVPISEFNHAIATVVVDGKNILMDPTSETSRNIFPEYLMDKSYLVAKKENADLLVTDSIPAIKNSEIITTNVVIKDDVYKINRKIELKGFADIAFRNYLTRINENKKKELFKHYAKRYSQDAKLISYSITPEVLTDSKPLVLKYEVESKSAIIGKNYKMAPLKAGESLFIGGYLSNLFKLSDRKYSLKTPITGGVVEKINIELGDNYKVLALPKNIELEDSGFNYKFDLNKNGNNITGEVRQLFDKTEYSTEDYNSVRKYLGMVQQINKKELILNSSK